jgi:hypothetical protein
VGYKACALLDPERWEQVGEYHKVKAMIVLYGEEFLMEKDRALVVYWHILEYEANALEYKDISDRILAKKVTRVNMIDLAYLTEWLKTHREQYEAATKEQNKETMPDPLVSYNATNQ